MTENFSKDEIFNQISKDFPSKERSAQVSEYYKSLLSKSMYEEATMKLVSLNHVLKYMQIIGSRLRTSLSQIPDRLSPRLAAENDEETVHHLLLREVKTISDGLSEIFNESSFIDEIEKAKTESPVLQSGKVAKKHRGKIG